jgi:arginine exporter protein ArgO
VVLTWLGLAALTTFAIISFRAARGRPGVSPAAGAPRQAGIRDLRRVVAVVWLNPLSYVEQLLIPAALCGSYQTGHARVAFMLGLIVMTALGDYGYSFCGGLCAPLLRHNRALRYFDCAAGMILLGVAVLLAITLPAP